MPEFCNFTEVEGGSQENLFCIVAGRQLLIIDKSMFSTAEQNFKVMDLQEF